MKRLLFSMALAAILVVPSAASARVVELGAGSTQPATSSCPGNPCRAVYQVTGYQGRSGNLKNPFLIRRDGYLVAFTVTLPSRGRSGGPSI